MAKVARTLVVASMVNTGSSHPHLEASATRNKTGLRECRTANVPSHQLSDLSPADVDWGIFWTEGGFDEIADGKCFKEGGEVFY